MHLEKRGRAFWVDFYVGHGKDRRRVRRSLKTDERALALERARDVVAELRAPKAAGTPLADFIPKYLAWSRDTKESYRSERYQALIIQKWFEARGIAALQEITPYLIEQFRIEVRARDRRTARISRGTSRDNANRYCALLRVMLNRAQDWGLFDGPNPVGKVKFYPTVKEMAVLTDAEKDAVIKAAQDISAHPDARSPIERVVGDFVLFLFNTGLRRSEALNLKWQNMRDTNIDVLGKGKKWRTVPLNATAQGVVARQSRISLYIFDIPNRHQPGLFRHAVLRIRNLAGVPTFHLHLCRHWFTVALLRAGVDIKTVGDILGHSRISTSLIYAHSSPEGRQRAVDALDTKSGHGTVLSATTGQTERTHTE